MNRTDVFAEPDADPHGADFTRLWPTAPDSPAEAPFFLAAVSPLRAAALGVLWATSSPGRFVTVLGSVLVLLAVFVVVL